VKEVIQNMQTQARSARTRTAVILFLAALLAAEVAYAAAAAGVTKRIRFPRGSTSTAIEGSVVRGDRDKYLLGAKAGQHMDVRISSAEENAVFQIYRPGGKRTLDDAGEGEDAMEWNGALPDSGDYTIYVGPTRGNATYKLEISIK
jgi:hypothetical protein